MDMLQIFHMNKGEGGESYAKNSNVQNEILSITKPFLEEALEDFLGDGHNFPETMAIADLGCSCGPNALTALSEILDVVAERCLEVGDAGKKSPKFMVFLNDLPGNDFNEVFACLASFQAKLEEEKGSDFGPCFIAGLPGSFHGRLLPDNCLHFVHSSSSLHWLSEVPAGLSNGKEKNPEIVNKGKIYLSKTSPKSVIKAYENQFRRDFLSFLKSRSKEVISGGRMVLSFMSRNTSTDPTRLCPWELIAHSLMTMVSEGLVEEEKVDAFNVPYYPPCLEELKAMVEQEGSFAMSRFEAFEVEWDGGERKHYSLDDEFETRGQRIAKMHRAVVESMLDHHFGRDIVDQLFIRYARVLDHLLTKQALKLTNMVISLTRN